MSRAGSRAAPAAVAAALIAGVVVASASGRLSTAWPAWWAAALIAALWARGRPILWLLAVFAAGGGLAAWDRAGAGSPPPVPAGEVELGGRVTAPVEPWDDGTRFTLVADRGFGVDVTVRGGPGPAPGDRVTVRGRLRDGRGFRNPGSAGARERALASRGAVASMSIAAADLRIDDRGWSPWRWPVAARRALSASIAERGGDRAGNPLARAMALGERGGVPAPAQARFRDAGIAHLLAVSGLHVGAVALLVLWIARRLWAAVPALSARVETGVASAIAAGGAAVFYTAVTGARTSTLRALVVVLILLAGSALCRRARFLDGLAVAALVLVATAPSIVFEPSFQLSFTAALTLALIARGPREPALGDAPPSRWQRALAWCGRIAAATVWVTAATAPLVARWFGAVPLASIPANLVAVPASELVVLPLALGGAVVAQAWPAAGGLAIDGAVAVAGAVDHLAGALAAALPPVTVPQPSALELCGWYAAMAVLIGWRQRALRPAAALIAGALAVAALSLSLAAGRTPPDDLRVTFVDVGQGDAALVELPGGAVWLVDAGGAPHVPDDLDPERRRALGALPGARALVPLLRARRITRIDRVILSHPHPDHFRGLAALDGVVELGELWAARGAVAGDRELEALVDRLGMTVVEPPLGARLDAGDGVGLTALAPRYRGTVAVDPVVSVNDNSLVVRIDRGGRSILFAGDLELEGETELVASGAVAADVIKVPHHGSRTSSSPALVAAVSPDVAVVSCGAGNRFGFPASEVLERWRRAGARVLRTDRNGAIEVRVTASGELLVAPFDP